MGISVDYQTIKVRYNGKVCFIQIHRPEHNNTINALLIEEIQDALAKCLDSISIVVLEGLPEVFCFGADFSEIHAQSNERQVVEQDPEPLYDLWMTLATGPYISVAHVKGKANAGGIGFVAACDIVLADTNTRFSLSELLFGVYPACVIPFLVRRIGFQKANYLTLTTKTINAVEASEWGLVDAYADNSDKLLQTHLRRLQRVTKEAVVKYKGYMNEYNPVLSDAKSLAINANLKMFSDPSTREKIFRYVETGQFSWE